MSMTIANVEMAKAWDGDEGDDWTRDADHYDAAAARFRQRFLDADLIRSDDRVLDIGCGTGQSSRDAAQIARSGSVLGVDLSARMLELARERSRAQGVLNTQFVQADAQVHPFDEASFDIAISRFGGMFFADRTAAFRNIATGIHPGGRLAFLAWRSLAENEWLVAIRGALAAGRSLPAPPDGAPGPFGLADADSFGPELGAAGFDDISFTALDEPIRLGTDAADASSFLTNSGMVRGLTQSLDEATREQALARLRQTLESHESVDGVLMGSAAWLITARRR